MGHRGIGFYEASDYESLYVDFSTANISGAGAGIHSFFEIGAMENLTLSFTIGYARLMSPKKFESFIRRDFFVADILGHYYFSDKTDKIQPYFAAGAGVMVSSGSAIPLADFGGGAHFMITDNFSLRLQGLFKTAVIHNRGEVSLDVGYHF